MKPALLAIGALFCLTWLPFAAHGVEGVPEMEPVEPAILLCKPDLFSVSPSVPLPEWIARVGYEGGEVGGDSPAWRMAEAAPAGTGKLWVVLDRSVLDENLAVSVVCERQMKADMVIQLWDGQDQIVALDLFGNIAAAALESQTDTFVVPLRKYPSATRIVLRRISGATTVFGMALIPVVMEKDVEPDTLAELQFARMLGDRLSPENELVRRVRMFTNGRSDARLSVPGVVSVGTPSDFPARVQPGPESPLPVAPGTPASTASDLQRCVYFIAGDNLYRMSLDGTGCVVVATGVSGARSLVADPASQMLYMITWSGAQILFYDVVKGGLVSKLRNGPGSNGQGLGYDPASTTFFAGRYYNGVYSLDEQQAGTWQHIVTPANIEPLLGQRGQIQLDPQRQHVYFRTAYNGPCDECRYVYRAGYDGSGLTKIIRANDGDGLALNVAAGHLYFTDGDGGAQRVQIKRANLDGTNPQTILTLPLPYQYGTTLELDVPNNKMYISLCGGWLPAGVKYDDRAIGRANLDGSEFEILWQMPGIGGGGGLAVFSR